MPKPPAPSVWYTAEEAAKYLGVKPATVTKHLRERTLKGKKVGPKQQWKVQGQEIRRLMSKWNLD